MRRLSFLAALLFVVGCTEMNNQGSGGTPASPEPITLGGSWSLVQLNGRQVGNGITLEFQSDRSIGGSAPCNRYFGDYTAKGDFSFSAPQIGATRRACPDLALESEYLSALSGAIQYRTGREGDTFALLGPNGQTVASYIRTQPPSTQIMLDGRWTIAAVRLNEVLTANPGPTTTNITFGPGGGFNANLGCNTASGPYAQNGNALDFGAIAVTTRQCFVPAPLEQPLLVAFEQIQTVAQTPGGIDLLDAGRQPLIRLVR